MATARFYEATNFANDTSFYDITFDNRVSANEDRVIIRIGGGETQRLDGNFDYALLENITDDSVITSLVEYNARGSVVRSFTNIGMDYGVYDDFATADNQVELYAYALSGNDIIVGSNDRDYLIGFAGDDRIYGKNGNDILKGSTGDDVLKGGSGTDALDGGAGRDVLFGDEGNDVLSAGTGNDTLVGGAGNDRLYGGTGIDLFIFSGSTGKDRIVDFDDSDFLRIERGINDSNINSYSDLDISTVGNNTVINFGDADNFLVLANFTGLDADHFIFYG